MPQPPRDQVFISYSHRDKRWLEDLQTMLKPLVRKQSISVWDDTKIKAGAKWKEQIEGALSMAKVAVLLVSPHFLASDFIAEHELPPILDTAAKEGLIILWVYVSSCLYEETEIAGYQAAHNILKPLDYLSRAARAAVLVNVCKQIKAAYNASLGPSPERAPGAAGRGVALSNLPERNPFFTGRELVLAQLQKALDAERIAEELRVAALQAKLVSEILGRAAKVAIFRESAAELGVIEKLLMQISMPTEIKSRTLPASDYSESRKASANGRRSSSQGKSL